MTHRARSAVLALALLAATAASCAPEDAVQADPGSASDGVVRRLPRVVGPLVIGDVREATLSSTTPDGYELTLAHARPVTLRASPLAGSNFAPRLRVFGPLTGTALPATPAREALASGVGGEAVLDGVALAPGRYVVTVACEGSRCRGQRYALLGAWANDPSAAATALFFRDPGGSRGYGLRGVLTRGRKVLVHYDAARYALNANVQGVASPGCRMAVRMHYRETPDGPFTAYALEAAGSGPGLRDQLSASVTLGADARRLEIYFDAAQSGPSCFNPNPEVWDSNEGRNFNFPVPDSVLRFAQGGVTVEGELRGGGTVAVDYDTARVTRLLTCRTSAYGANLVNLTAHHRYDGWRDFTAVTVMSSSSPGSLAAGPFTPVVPVPAGAHELEVYFRATAAGCEAYDSDYARNFRFPVR